MMGIQQDIIPDNQSSEEPLAIVQLASRILPVMARRKATNKLSLPTGNSLFYDLNDGWEIQVLKQDDDIKKVYTTLGLEKAFRDNTVKTILIPKDSAITRHVALRICSRHAERKTVFYEDETCE